MMRPFSMASLLILIIALPQSAYSGVVVFDIVASPGNPVRLRALTKGRFFPEGGRIIDFFVSDRHLGSTLSGGDGYAFLEYIPKGRGLKKMKVKSGEESSEGMLLVARRNEKVILLEIEGSLMKSSLLTNEPGQDSSEVIKKLMDKYRIIYLTSLLGVELSRKLLSQGKVPPSVILKWKGPELLHELKELHLRLSAVVGSPAIISEASEQIKKRYTFSETDDGVVVKDWKELAEKLEPGKKKE
jgi:hypothetical protein